MTPPLSLPLRLFRWILPQPQPGKPNIVLIAAFRLILLGGGAGLGLGLPSLIPALSTPLLYLIWALAAAISLPLALKARRTPEDDPIRLFRLTTAAAALFGSTVALAVFHMLRLVAG
ncbi:hypothetical protein [Rhodobacter ferrooxidans]|uniref:Uncharacterized protein n=1 Tax=Rhodobacter ferrooxidans TaxID=371731 RepID=C8S478_9RHOB|nr:hypothetical protein [Rhodobacter sp. SW2]EEW24244.1 hypothetical protein Rsw2DRAFT_2864 [Rhodobacter sp. SW2]